jgi:hypothetical protein
MRKVKILLLCLFSGFFISTSLAQLTTVKIAEATNPFTYINSGTDQFAYDSISNTLVFIHRENPLKPEILHKETIGGKVTLCFPPC